MRAHVWPTRVFADWYWSRIASSSLEVTAVFASLAADAPLQQDVEISGVGVASNAHIGFIQRFEYFPRWTLWARARALLARSTTVARARADLNEDARIQVQARSNLTEGASGVSGTLGLLWAPQPYNLRLGIGYGTWFLPWIDLPIGMDTITVDLDFYTRF